MWCGLLLLVGACAGADAKANPAHLLLPRAGQDHSAYRLDTEVFGFSANYREVAGVCMEVMRGPQGRHRGESYMLVYRLGETLPKYNIICHNITHADFPDDPVALEDASAFLWSIETSFHEMWPRPAIHTWRKGFMQVQALTAIVPAEPSSAATLAQPSSASLPPGPSASGPLTKPAQGPPAPAQAWGHPFGQAESGPQPLVAPIGRPLSGAEADPASPKANPAAPSPQPWPKQVCVPWVGLSLRWHGERRITPFRPVDVTANCALLHASDQKTYWGKADVAASMVRMDFASRPSNEESARFVVSANWAQARRLQIRLEVAPGVPAAAQRAVARALASVAALAGGPVDANAKATPADARALRLLAVDTRAAADWLALPQAVLVPLGVQPGERSLEDALGDRLVVRVRPAQQRPSASALAGRGSWGRTVGTSVGAQTQAQHVVDAAPAQVPSVPSMRAPQPNAGQVVHPASQFLRDWHVGAKPP